MTGKKDLYKFTVQFSRADPTHRQTADLLNQQGRRKAQFLVNAVMHYIHCRDTPDIPPLAISDTALIETVVKRILNEQRAERMQEERKPDGTQPSEQPPAEPLFEDTADILGSDGLAAIADTLAMFRKD